MYLKFKVKDVNLRDQIKTDVSSDCGIYRQNYNEIMTTQLKVEKPCFIILTI